MLAIILNVLRKIYRVLYTLVHSKGIDTTFGCNYTEDLFVASGQVVTLTAPGPGEPQKIFQYRNVTIEEGGVLTATHNPFILQVSGTLTVNGHLHMNGKGGVGETSNSHSSYYTQSGALNTGTYTILNKPVYDADGASVPISTWQTILNYLKSDHRLDMDFCVTGAGGGNRYGWKRATKYRTRHHGTYGIANGNVPGSRDWQSGGAGGCLLLVYNKYSNKGPKYSYNGQNYPLNITANGGIVGTRYRQWRYKNTNYGGGYLFIAASSIIVGPNGKITCDNNTENNGTMALMNLPPSQDRYHPVVYNNGSPYQRSDNSGGKCGGGGVCIGIDIGEEL